jgi:hypothetical protein
MSASVFSIRAHRGSIRWGLPIPLLSLAFSFFAFSASPATAQTEEKESICEVKPVMRCLDKAELEGRTIKVPIDAAAIRKDGFRICDSSFNYTTSPDIVLIMDNTLSMDSLIEVDGVPRWCDAPDKNTKDPGCISGDPRRLRGPALQSFLDSALAKGGSGVNVGVVTFNDVAEAKSDKLVPLTAATIDGIKSSIVMEERGATNYTKAFQKAIDLLRSSRKPRQEQFIIFVSDGRPDRPERPDGDPHDYTAFWDSLPVVHCIFLGDNAGNYKDMQDISVKTGGTFFNIKDVSLLAKYLTDDLAKKLFRRASPTSTTVRNLSASVLFQMDGSGHVSIPDSGAYALKMPGPMELAKGVNDIVVKTEYGYGGATQDVHFKIERTATGPYFDGLEERCRDLPLLKALNDKGEDLMDKVSPYYTINDSALRYSLTTSADLDSFDIVIRTTSPVTAQKDLEAAPNNASNRKDSTWTGSMAFQHQTVKKTQADKRIQADHGETVYLSYHNPYIREDSALVKVKIKYGPGFGTSAYRDLDHDGRIETVTIRFLETVPILPEKLEFDIRDAAGATAQRIVTASKGEIAFAKDDKGAQDNTGLLVKLSDPFPFGMTSVANADSSGRTFRQNDIPMADSRFRVDDSVPPVIVSAEVPAATDGSKRVKVTYSEPVTLEDPFLQPLIFKRDTMTYSAKDAPLAGIDSAGPMDYVFHLAPEAAFKPVGGDSVAINDNGETRDLNRIAPPTRVFTAMGGPSPSQTISGFYVTFANGSKSKAAGAALTVDGDVRFIPVDEMGHALPGSGNGKCERCNPLQDGVFTGSVIHVLTKHPVTYEFTIYTNLGELVARGSGKVEEGDLPLLERIEDAGKDPNQAQYDQRIVWTGRTESGQLAGTGAYVLKAVFKYEKNSRTGARASSVTKFTRFGFLRTCCEDYNGLKWWFK